MGCTQCWWLQWGTVKLWNMYLFCIRCKYIVATVKVPALIFCDVWLCRLLLNFPLLLSVFVICMFCAFCGKNKKECWSIFLFVYSNNTQIMNSNFYFNWTVAVVVFWQKDNHGQFKLSRAERGGTANHHFSNFYSKHYLWRNYFISSYIHTSKKIELFCVNELSIKY
jgi:hypothetical protein